MEVVKQKALIYCRVSSEKQVKEGNGLDSQEHRCREYANSLNLEVERIFRDEGISGGLFDRPAMKSMIDYLDNHWQNKYFVIFDDLKRFARDVQVHIKLKSELRSRGVKLLCLNYNFDESPEGEFVETIFAAQNQLERKQNKRQVCQKMKARLERGYWTFFQPSGYEYKKTKEHGKLLVPIQQDARIITEALISFSSNKLMSQVDVVRFLNEKRFFQESAKETTRFNFVKRLLVNPIYAGFVEYPQWGISRREGHHRPLISKDIFYKNQEKIKRPKRIPRATDTLEWPLRRMINCAICGKPMTGSCNRSKNPNLYYPHYTCNNKLCSANPKNITKSLVEEQYKKILNEASAPKEILELARTIAVKVWNEKLSNSSNNRQIIEEEIEEINKQIDEYVDLIPTTKSPRIKVRYEAKIDGLDKKAKELELSLKNKKEPNFEEALKLTLDFLGTPGEYWEKADPETRIMIHKLIFPENPSYCFQDGFGTPNLSVPFYIKHYITDPKKGLVEVVGIAPASKRLKTHHLQA